MTEEESFTELLKEIMNLEAIMTRSLDDLEQLRGMMSSPESNTNEEGKFHNMCDAFLCQYHEHNN